MVKQKLQLKLPNVFLAQVDPVTAIQVHRATPVKATGYSPAELMLGRKIRTTLPCLASNLKPVTPDHNIVKENDINTKSKYKQNFDKHHGAQKLHELKPKTIVRMNESDNQQDEHLEPPRQPPEQRQNIRPMPELGRLQLSAKPIKRLIEVCTICKDLGRYG